jgi:histidine ammonia-lyase
VRTRLRREVPHLDEDRSLHPDQQAATRLVRSGAVVEAAGSLPSLCA